MPVTQERLTCALLGSVPSSLFSTVNSLSGQYLFKRVETTSTIDSFKSWNTCMDNHVCKIVAIVLIVVGGLLFIWLFGGILRCMCCGANMASSLCCCLSSMCSCCGSDNHNHRRHEQAPPPPPPPLAPYYNNIGYQQAPAMSSDIYTRAGPDLASAPLPSQVYNNNQTNNPLYNYGEERFGSNGELEKRAKEKDQENLQRLRIKREIYEEEKQARKRQEEELQKLNDQNSRTNQFDNEELPDNIAEANQHAYNRANNLASPTDDHFGEPVAPLNVINPDKSQPSYTAYQGNFYSSYNNNDNTNNVSTSYGNSSDGYEMQNLAPRNPFADQNLQGITAFNPAEYLQKQKQQQNAATLPDPSNLVTSEHSNIMYPKNTEIFTGIKESPNTISTSYYDSNIYHNNDILKNSNENMFQPQLASTQQNSSIGNVRPYNSSMIHPQQPPSDSDFVRKSMNLSEAHASFDSKMQSPLLTEIRNSQTLTALSSNTQNQNPHMVHDEYLGEITSESPLIGKQRASIVASDKSSSRNSLYVLPLFGSKTGKNGRSSERFSSIPNTRKDTLNDVNETSNDADFVKTPLMQLTDQNETTAAQFQNEKPTGARLPYPPSNSIL